MPVTPTYDAYGNLIDDGTWGYSYDADNRLVDAARSVPTMTTAKYKYDGIDRRYTKTVDLTTRTDYLWSGQNIVAEYAVPNTATPGTQSLQRRYVFGPGIDEPVAVLQYNGAATPVLSDIQYFHADHLGSIVALSNTSGGIWPAAGSEDTPFKLVLPVFRTPLG